MTENSYYIRFDWAIKRILRDKANSEVLEGLMTVLIGQPIKIVEILESESNQDSHEDKFNRVDVKARMGSGELVIVEVQLTKESNFFQRILFGASKAVTEQISIGRHYDAIKKVYSINILYFDFGTGDDYAYHGVTTFRGMNNAASVLQFNNEREKEYMQKSTQNILPPEEVFPEYFLLRVNQFNEVAKTPIEEWMAYLKDGIIRDNTKTPGLQAAREKLAYMRMTDRERRAYDDYMVSVHAAKDAWDTLKADGFNEGYHEGIEKGMEEGMEKGMQKGMEKGIMQVAQNMKANGVPVEVISKYTGLTSEEIAQI